MTGKNVSIRPATSDDAADAAPLIALAMGKIGPILFGGGDPARAAATWAALFAWRGSRFSHEFADVAVAAGRVVGLALRYPHARMGHIALATARQMLRLRGLPGFGRFVLRALPLAAIPEARPGEYFLDALAVLPEFSRIGIGALIVGHVEDHARATGLPACACTSEIGNDPAHHLFERLGYRVVETFRVSATAGLGGFRGVDRLVKRL